MLPRGFGECGDKRQGPGVEVAQVCSHRGDLRQSELPDQQMPVVQQPVLEHPLHDQRFMTLQIELAPVYVPEQVGGVLGQVGGHRGSKVQSLRSKSFVWRKRHRFLSLVSISYTLIITELGFAQNIELLSNGIYLRAQFMIFSIAQKTKFIRHNEKAQQFHCT
jgi:hypothetical protein